VIISVVVVASIYLTMNTSIIGVVPWREAMESENIAADFMQRLFGRGVAVAFTWLIRWTVMACMFAITLGYSRIPFAAARNGDFFPIFAKVHRGQNYPIVSLVAVGTLTAAFCFFSLELVIISAVTIRIGVQFIGQIVALHVLRKTRPDVHLPFRMWLYPVPSLIALVGWIFVLLTPDPVYRWHPLLMAVGVTLSGCVAFFAWQTLQPARPVGGAR
jgi:amino acid transporter